MARVQAYCPSFTPLSNHLLPSPPEASCEDLVEGTSLSPAVAQPSAAEEHNAEEHNAEEHLLLQLLQPFSPATNQKC